jgi:hypothetical protein
MKARWVVRVIRYAGARRLQNQRIERLDHGKAACGDPETIVRSQNVSEEEC